MYKQQIVVLINQALGLEEGLELGDLGLEGIVAGLEGVVFGFQVLKSLY